LIDIILDILAFIFSRRSALKLTCIRIEKSEEKTVYHCKLKNKHSEYIETIVPLGEINHLDDKTVKWLLNFNGTEQSINFHSDHLKKLRIIDNKYLKEYKRIVLKPNSEVSLILQIPFKREKKLGIQLGYMVKIYNSTCRIINVNI